MTREFLVKLGEKYCETRPGSCLVDVSVEKMVINTWYRGAILTSDAAKVAEMLGIDLKEQGVA